MESLIQAISSYFYLKFQYVQKLLQTEKLVQTVLTFMSKGRHLQLPLEVLLQANVNRFYSIIQ